MFLWWPIEEKSAGHKRRVAVRVESIHRLGWKVTLAAIHFINRKPKEDEAGHLRWQLARRILAFFSRGG